VQPDNIVIEITGAETKINQFLLLVKDFGILDLTRTGVVALPRS
jgi:acetolactate synthase-1/3 small subunit